MHKYLFFSMFIRNGEYEYSSNSVGYRSATDKHTLEYWGDKHAKTFYGSKPEKEQDGDGYYFNGGEVYVRCRVVMEITKEEYDILNKFQYI